MGSLLSPKTPPAPPPPPPPEYINIRDEVARTESIYVTNPDGSKTMVTKRLPLTPEEQAYEDKLKTIASDSLAWMEKLSTDYDRAQIPWLDKYLTDWETDQIGALDAALSDRTDQEERALARFGQADSTSAIKTRAHRGADYVDSREQIGRDLSAIEQGVRNNELGNAQNLYALATGRQDAILSNLAGSLGRSQQFQLADAGLQQNRNLAVYGGGLQQQQIAMQQGQAGMQNLAALASSGAYGFNKAGGFGALGRKVGWL